MHKTLRTALPLMLLLVAGACRLSVAQRTAFLQLVTSAILNATTVEGPSSVDVQPAALRLTAEQPVREPERNAAAAHKPCSKIRLASCDAVRRPAGQAQQLPVVRAKAIDARLLTPAPAAQFMVASLATWNAATPCRSKAPKSSEFRARTREQLAERHVRVLRSEWGETTLVFVTGSEQLPAPRLPVSLSDAFLSIGG